VSKTERTKGAAAEREVVHIFRASGWPNAERTSNGRQQRGRNDVANGPAGCAIEIKRQEALSVPKALDQLARDSDPLDVPILVHRPSRHAWMATLPLADLLDLRPRRLCPGVQDDRQPAEHGDHDGGVA
jgi:hypothetical protein